MDGLHIVLAVVGVIVVVFGGMALLLPYLAKKGVNLPGVVSSTNTVLATAGAIVDGLNGLFPDSGAFKLIDKIIGYAEQATKAAEQLYHTSQIEAGERNAAAVKLVYEMLGAAGVEITGDVKKIVDGCIEAAVFVLPKTHEAVAEEQVG